MPGAGKGSSSVPRGFSASSMESPLYPGSSGLVRTNSVIRSEREAWVIQVLLTVTL